MFNCQSEYLWDVRIHAKKDLDFLELVRLLAAASDKTDEYLNN